MTVKTIHLEKPTTADYARLLRLRNIKYKEVDDRYYQVGNIRGEQGWILHVSATKALVPDLLNRLIPELSKEKVAFKFIQNEGYADKTVSGAYGYTWLGKIIRIYPETTERAVQLAKKLIELTAGFIGPVIPTDSWLGGTVYTRYGAHNPTVIANAIGQNENYIHNVHGQLIKDPNEVPFQLTKGIAWPFGKISPPQPSTNTKTLFNRYVVRSELRTKPKGRVLKTYRVKGLSIKSAVVKEAKHGMCDETGRSLAERLHWQEKLHRELIDSVRLPEIFELFEERGNTYLSMEFIKGKPLVEAIAEVYANGTWRMLEKPAKLKLLTYLKELLSIVEIFHNHGYVHRDLTPENFIVDGNDRLVMIDLELAYGLTTQYPTPPYRLGTMGYMSPEQLDTNTPTVKEDIFALGALMIVFFTNISPAKFNIQNEIDLKGKLRFFFEHEQTIDVITQCLNTEAVLRPSLTELQEVIECLQNDAMSDTRKKDTSTEATPTVSEEELITRTLQSFATATMATEGNPWHSNQLELSVILGNKKTDYVYYPGFHTGIAGVLTAIAQASLVGMKINNQVLNAYNRNLRHLQRTFISNLAPGIAPGLYYGAAGVGIAIATGLESGLINTTQDFKAMALKCLSQENTELNVARGAAGQGIALLRSISVIGHDKTYQLLASHISAIIKAQQPDGSWIEKGEGKTGFSEGIAGIIVFLLRYNHTFTDQHAKSAAERGLTYLKTRVRRSHGKIYWPISNKNADAEVGFQNGFLGVTVALLAGYRYLNDPACLTLATEALNNYPAHPVGSDITVSYGISGLGETYLEAYQITGKEEWKSRASWLVNVLYATAFDKKDGSNFWIHNPNQFVTADLLTGNSGVLHFLIRHLFPNKLDFIV